MNLKEFQAQYGADWGHLLSNPAFGAALALANAEKIQSILILSDEEIASKGTIILADLRGHLRYEAGILGLHERKELVFQSVEGEEYPDPEREAFELSQEGDQSAGGAPLNEQGSSPAFEGDAHQQIFPVPERPRKKRVPSKGKARKIPKTKPKK